MKNLLILNFLALNLNLWADLAVTPPLLQYRNDDKYNEITIKNTSERDRLFDISIKKWTQKDGKDIYEDTDDLIVMPITTKVIANNEKMVRVILKKPIAEATQNSYRLFIREAPSGKKKVTNGTSFEFLFSIIVPVFTHGKNFAANDNLVFTAQQDINNNKVLVTITNLGNTVALLSGVSAKSVSNTSYDQARYILHGTSYSWEFPLKVKKTIAQFTLDYLLNEKKISKSLSIISDKLSKK